MGGLGTLGRDWYFLALMRACKGLPRSIGLGCALMASQRGSDVEAYAPERDQAALGSLSH
jgi:hypothetical protein